MPAATNKGLLHVAQLELWHGHRQEVGDLFVCLPGAVAYPGMGGGGRFHRPGQGAVAALGVAGR